jgi:hypothetical protein
MNNKNGSADFVTKVSRAIALLLGNSEHHVTGKNPKHLNLGPLLSIRYQPHFQKRKPVAAQRVFRITILFPLAGLNPFLNFSV